MPRVTMCVSVLDDPVLLKECLQCVQDQSFKDWECIVVDDGSKESHEPVVTAFNDDRFIFHRFEENKGIPHGGNYAFKRARGEYICSLGVDERICPSKFEDQVNFLDAHPIIDLIWGVPGNGPMGPVPSWEQYSTKAHNRSRQHWIKTFMLLEGVPVGGASAMWKRSLFDSVGYMREDMTAFSDHELFVRIIEKHNVMVLPYRWINEVRGGNKISGDTPVNRDRVAKEYQKACELHPLMGFPHDGLITIAMPVYNHARFVGDMLKSLFAQTDQNFEVLMIDDGSTDELEKAIEPWRERIQFSKNEKNEGMMACANKMLEKAKGEFFVLLSADDTIDPTFLEKCRLRFFQDPFLEYVASQNDFMGEDGKPFEGTHPLLNIPKAVNHTQAEWHELFYHGNVYFGVGMYRTSAIRDVGGWSPEHGVISDYEMYLKLLPRYTFWVIQEPLTHTRIHGENQSLLKPEIAKDLKNMYFKAQRPYYQPRPKIIVATPFYELKGFSPYIESLTATFNILRLSGINCEFMALSGDSYVHRARNTMCMNFLKDPYNTDLFFIDSDMAWTPQSLISMIFRPEPIIGGTYPVKNKWDMWTSKPVIADPEKDPHYVGYPLPDGSALIKAHQLAGGFLRIKRSVLEKFIEFYPTSRYGDSHPIPEERQEQVEFFSCGIDRTPEMNLLKEIESRLATSNGSGVKLDDLREKFDALKTLREFVGEDYYFSNKLRDMGIELFIYPNCTISHFGIQAFTGNFNDMLHKKGFGQPPAETEMVYP